MAKDNNLGDFLTEIANAIRAKKGSSESINAQDFANEIASIEGGGSSNDTTVDDLLSNKLTALKSDATSLRQYVLRGATNLKSVDLPNVKTVYANALYNVGLTEVYLPSCTKVEGTTICYCNSLVKIDLPLCTSLGNYVFRDNKMLSDVSLPSLPTLPQNAFYNCVALTKISLPKVKTINTLVFNGCTNFETLILGASSVVTLSNTNALSDTKIASGTGYIYVPSTLVDSYKTATNWTTYANQIRAIEDYPEITA
jgi:hypothetical protein